MMYESRQVAGQRLGIHLAGVGLKAGVVVGLPCSAGSVDRAEKGCSKSHCRGAGRFE